MFFSEKNVRVVRVRVTPKMCRRHIVSEKEMPLDKNNTNNMSGVKRCTVILHEAYVGQLCEIKAIFLFYYYFFIFLYFLKQKNFFL